MLVKVKRWSRLSDFNPQSPLQVKEYLRFKKIPIPRHRTRRDKNGEKSETTDDESLTELLREGKAGYGDKVLEKVLESRHVSKALSYLSEKYIYPDKRMRPIYTVKPKSGRLSSARPNIMNQPKSKKGLVLARASKIILASIIPDPGFTLFSADWKAIEPALIGYFANDPDYARVGRLGSHAYVLSHYLRKPIDLTKSDEEILAEMEVLKTAHKNDYAICKTGNMAYLYLQGVMNMARGLWLSVERTKEIRTAIDLSAPKVKKWKIDTLKMAHFQGRLTNPFGFSMTYFDIFKTEGGKVLVGRDGMPVLGREAPEAISFPAQSTGAAMLRKVLVDLGNHPEEGPTFQILACEHDKLVGQIREGSDVERLLTNTIIPSMTRKWAELSGLSIDVDVEVGPSWQMLKSWRKAA